MNVLMPINPHTGLYNVTHEEVEDARLATEDVILVREDGTLTKDGQLYVADVRSRGHEECDTCHPESLERSLDQALTDLYFGKSA